MNTNTSVPIEARFKPNYEVPCEVCTRIPTVDIYVRDALAERTCLCGVCTWGERECSNPANW